SPVVELAACISSTYSTLGNTEDLSWRLRGVDGHTSKHAVMNFIRERGAHAAVRELILPSREVTKVISDKFSFTIFEEPQDSTIDRLLWKFGFSIPRYEDEYSLLRQRLEAFKGTVISLPRQPNEENRAQVRSVGVNLFVS